jgi:hypothetical protein
LRLECLQKRRPRDREDKVKEPLDDQIVSICLFKHVISVIGL